MEQRFFICQHCGNLVGIIKRGGGQLHCCGAPMEQMKIHDEYDAGYEKHIPVVRKDGNMLYASVGAITHPMTDEHHIDWIYLETYKGGQRKMCLDQAKATFSIEEDTPMAVYAFCNQHGLWKLEI